MRIRNLPTAPLLLTLLLGTAAARDLSPQSSSLLPAEREALSSKASGRYGEARDRFIELLRDAEGDSPEAAERAEFQVAMAELLARRTGRVDLRTTFVQLADEPFAERHPFVRDRLLQAALGLARSAGDAALGQELTVRLGHVTSFWVVGPFDNERGAGFARTLPPEAGWDPDATFDGKKRPVRWRQLPVAAPPGGYVDFDAMVRPNEQVLCYAAAALVAERARSVVLHLGSDEAVKVFLNGAEVFSRDVRRAFAPDQDACRLDLRAGPNLLVLKVCDQEGGFGFAARLRDVDGRPVTDVVDRDDPAVLRAAATTEPSDSGAGGALFRGALTTLRTGAENGDAASLYRLGLLLALRQPDDPADRRDLRYARRAVTAAPEFAPARYLLGFTLVREGRAEERDENSRRRIYSEILERQPSHVEALRNLAEIELQTLGAATTAQQLLERALAANPEFRPGHLLSAQVLDAIGLEDLAARARTRAARADDDGGRHPEGLRTIAGQLVEHRRFAEAEMALRALLSIDYRASTVTDLSRLLERRGARDEALELLAGAEALLPFQRSPRTRQASLLRAAGHQEGALRALGRWLEVCPEDDAALVAVAELHALRGEIERQREMLRAALALNPNRKVERRLLEFLEADAHPFYDAYRLDGDAVIAADRGPRADAAEAHDSHEWLLRHDVVRAYRNGTTSVYRHRILRILSEAGAREFDRWFVPHFWGEQRARILTARVLKQNGEVRRPRLMGAFAELPPLAIGDVLEVESRVDDTSPSFFGDYFGLVHTLTADDGAPVNRSQLTAVLDDERTYRVQGSGGAPEAVVTTDGDGRTVHSWELRDLPRRDAEERRPSWKESAPLVRITTYEDWDQFANWWWNLIRKQVEVSPQIRAKVRELVADRETEAERIAAIYEFVTTEIRYKAWEFGVHGYKPYSVPVIYERRHGDCKDKSLLLNAMLGEIGVEAYPVLIWADPLRSADDLSLAMVEHFNHCISYLPATDARPAMFLDGTATWHPTDTTPEMDQGARVLVVHGERGELRDVPRVSALDNVDHREFDVELRANGSAAITLTLRPTRNEAVGLREAMGNEPGKRGENIERMLGRQFGAVTVESVDVSDPLDLAAPMRVTVRFSVEDLAPRQGDGLSLLAVFEDEPMQELTPATERRWPMLLGVPSSRRTVTRYRLPDGWEPIDLPAPVRAETRFGSFELSWRLESGVLEVAHQRALRAPRIEPAEYPEFREFARQVDESERRPVVVQEGGR